MLNDLISTPPLLKPLRNSILNSVQNLRSSFKRANLGHLLVQFAPRQTYTKIKSQIFYISHPTISIRERCRRSWPAAQRCSPAQSVRSYSGKPALSALPPQTKTAWFWWPYPIQGFPTSPRASVFEAKATMMPGAGKGKLGVMVIGWKRFRTSIVVDELFYRGGWTKHFRHWIIPPPKN